MKKSLINDHLRSETIFGIIWQDTDGKKRGGGGGRGRVEEGSKSACCRATSQYANEHQNEEVVRDKVSLQSSCQSKRNHHRKGTKGQEAYASVCMCVRTRVTAWVCMHVYHPVPSITKK